MPPAPGVDHAQATLTGTGCRVAGGVEAVRLRVQAQRLRRPAEGDGAHDAATPRVDLRHIMGVAGREDAPERLVHGELL